MIITSFKIPITNRQGGQARSQWARHGRPEGAMIIAQPIASWGPFSLRYGFLNCYILDKKTANRIAKVLEAAKKENAK